MESTFDPAQLGALPQQTFPQQIPPSFVPVDPVVWVAIEKLGDGQRSLQGQHDRIFKELLILEAFIKQSLDPMAYVEERKRIEAELFPPPVSADKAELEEMKGALGSMQKDHADFRAEVQGALRDLAGGIKEMTDSFKVERDREKEPLEPQIVEAEPVDEEDAPDEHECPICAEVFSEAEYNGHVASHST